MEGFFPTPTPVVATSFKSLVSSNGIYNENCFSVCLLKPSFVDESEFCMSWDLLLREEENWLTPGFFIFLKNMVYRVPSSAYIYRQTR